MSMKTEIFEKLVKLGIIDGNGKILYSYMKFQVPGSTAMMDLNIDRLWDDRISMAHNTIQNGDVMADPDMEIKINAEKKEAFAYSFQNDFVGFYDTAYIDEGVFNESKVKEHSEFLNGWLDNIFDQGYEPVKKEGLEE